MEEPGRLQSMGSLRVGHDWATSLSLFTFMHWRRNGNPLQCSCLENPRDGGAWWAAVYGVAQSRTQLKRLSSSSSSSRLLSLFSAKYNTCYSYHLFWFTRYQDGDDCLPWGTSLWDLFQSYLAHHPSVLFFVLSLWPIVEIQITLQLAACVWRIYSHVT